MPSATAGRPARSPRPAGERAAPRGAPRPDAGFSLIEVMVALGLIGTVMTALTTFFMNTMSITDAQADAQTAVQLANDGVERMRSLKGSAVTSGRDKTSTVQQWAAPVAGVGDYLTDMAPAWDGSAAYPSGATAPLPTVAEQVPVDGHAYARSWYIGQCWQPASGGDCTAVEQAGTAAFYRVVVAVTWSGRRCPAAGCAYVTSTLVSSAATEPVFTAAQGARPPAVDNPGNQVGELTVAVSLQLTYSGGAPPVIWAASGLPPGLAVSSSGLISGVPTSPGTYTVTASATDGFDLVGTAGFTWTVNALPALADPGPQTSAGGRAAALSLARTGGTAPLAWAVDAPGDWGPTGLPPGLAIDPGTGAISGTPTRAGAGRVRVRVTDAFGASAVVEFGWSVPALAVQTPPAVVAEVGVATAAVQVVATGGVVPYTWAATGLPGGLALSSSGKLSGTPTTAGTWAGTVSVTDASGVTVRTDPVRWTVAARPAVGSPTGTLSGQVGGQVAIAASVRGGTAPFTWTASDLPPGLAMSPDGVISGRYTGGTRFLSTITVTDAFRVSASTVLTWTVGGAGTLQVSAPTADRSDKVGAAVSLTARATGGSGSGYAWSATGLPPGVSASGTGLISGRPTSAGSYRSTLTVVDSSGARAVFVFTWRVS